MRTSSISIKWGSGLLLCFLFLVASDAYSTFEPAEQNARNQVILFSKTSSFRHESIPNGIATLTSLLESEGLVTIATEDASIFLSDLSEVAAVVFLNTTGDVLNETEQAGMEAFIKAGGGFVGIHAAADTEYEWPWYGDLVGAYFAGHPAVQNGTIKVADRAHPSTSSLPQRWERTDEWYNYDRNPRGTVHVLASLDESTYSGGTQGYDHPIAWCHDYDGGRSWYTGGGHTPESYEEPLFQEHLRQGILYASGLTDGDCGATVNSNFEKVVLDANTRNPIDLDVAPDGRVFFIERAGELQIFSPTQQTTITAGTLEVETSNEDGLLGVVLDPDFASNNFLYLFYSPLGNEAIQRISRFTLNANTLDLTSETILLEIPVQRTNCCHSGGSLAFDAQGNLFIATGDNTNPFSSDGFAPIDERPERSDWDAQKSAGNTNDLRGKILRISPQPDGSYTIPEGNLFTNPEDGRPEIYAMGLRNPYRISVDTETGWLYWGDIGPDAFSDNPARGPLGYDEWNQAKAAGNFGWPYCIADNQAYVEYDFGTGLSGDAYNCSAPENNSPNNTGNVTLPPARPAWIWYPYGTSSRFPALGDGGRTAMAGPYYHVNEQNEAENRLPAYYDNTLFIYEWSRNWIKEVKLDAAGEILEINPFVPHIPLQRPISMKAGPDGVLYLLEWGAGFGGDNENAQLVRIDYVRGSRAPVAIADADPLSGPVPLEVQFDARRSFDPDPGSNLSYAWDFDDDGTPDATTAQASYIFTTPGVYTARLTVTDASGDTGTATRQITAGNTAPAITLKNPVDGGFFQWGDRVPFAFSVTDAEDGTTADSTISCANTLFQPLIGHDDHSHPLEQFNACEGVFETVEGHGSDGDRVFYLVEASYADRGIGGAGSLTARTLHRLQTKRIQSEHFTINNGVLLETTGDVLGGRQNIGFIDHGDFVSYETINLLNINHVTFRTASAGWGGRIEIRANAPDGPLLGFTDVGVTGQWQTYREVTALLDDPGGTNELFLVFLREPENAGLFNVNWMEFGGAGVKEELASEGAQEFGLNASYFSGVNFSGNSINREDPKVNFYWSDSTPPHPELDSLTFSVRWLGWLWPEESGPYILHARASGGVRLQLNNEVIIDQWIEQEEAEISSAGIDLIAGERYPIQLEYFEEAGIGEIDLLWTPPSGSQVIIPYENLSPAVIPVGRETADDLDINNLVLEAPFPNPVRTNAEIEFFLPASSDVHLAVYDVLGRHIDTLTQDMLKAGRHRIQWKPDIYANGTYFIRLQVAEKILTRPITVTR